MPFVCRHLNAAASTSPKHLYLYEDFPTLLQRHHAQQRKLLAFISAGLCHKVYLDMGTNIGTQIRKLYQPEYYGDAPILPYYDNWFGKDDRRKVCAIGIEANGIHTAPLLVFQETYQQAGYPTIIFTNTAAATYDGNVTFYLDSRSGGDRHQWGASTSRTPDTQNGSATVALAMDINSFLHKISHAWHSWYSKTHRNPGKLFTASKCDVEGSEFSLLPYLLRHGSLCLINAMYTEWHPHTNPFHFKFKADYIKKLLVDAVDPVFNDTSCRVNIVDLDDETYFGATDDTPFPPFDKNMSLLLLGGSSRGA